MGGGDLNMYVIFVVVGLTFELISWLNRKKSWHPVLLTNQARVWEVEKKAVSFFIFQYVFCSRD
jgi:hypothetical protein